MTPELVIRGFIASRAYGEAQVEEMQRRLGFADLGLTYVEDVLEGLAELRARGERAVVVRVDSGGGYLAPTLLLYGELRAFSDSGGTVVVYVEGDAHSSASGLILAGDAVVLGAAARIIVHTAVDLYDASAVETAARANGLMVELYLARTATPGHILARGVGFPAGSGLVVCPEAALSEGWADAQGDVELAHELAARLTGGGRVGSRRARILAGKARAWLPSSLDAAAPAVASLARPSLSSPVTFYRGASFGPPVLMDPIWQPSTAYAVGARVCADPSAGSPAGYPMSWSGSSSGTYPRNVYVCAQAGTGIGSPGYPGPTGTGTNIIDGTCRWNYVGTVASQERIKIETLLSYAIGSVYLYRFKFTIRPMTDDDNLDALRTASAKFYPSSGGVSDDHVVAVPDRRYRTPGTPSDSTNAAEVTISSTWYVNNRYASAPNAFNGYARVELANALGASTRDYGQAPNALGQQWTGGASIPGLGSPPAPDDDGSGGGACPSPETPILMANGSVKPAGELEVGDEVWTLPEDGGAWGAYRVSHVSVHHSKRLRLVTDDGGRVALVERADDGDVVKISVESARTYVIASRDAKVSPLHRVASPAAWHHVADLEPGDRLRGDVPGILSHNLKPHQV